MPNAHEYRDAASQLRRLATQLVDDWASLRAATDPTELAGGPLAIILGRAVDVHLRHVERAHDELTRVAAICETRATICDEFTAALRRHARLVWSGVPCGPPPERPARWVSP